MAYVLLKNQTNRLGEFSDLGQGADYINAIGNAVVGVMNSIGTTKVAVRQSKDTRMVAVTESLESTKKLGIQTQGMTEQARIAADQAKSKYHTIPIVILVSGATLIGAIGVGAWAYNKMVGDYEIEYE